MKTGFSSHHGSRKTKQFTVNQEKLSISPHRTTDPEIIISDASSMAGFGIFWFAGVKSSTKIKITH